MLTIGRILLYCAVLQESCDEYYTADAFNILLEIVLKTCIVEFLQEAGFFYVIWMITPLQFITWIILELMQ